MNRGRIDAYVEILLLLERHPYKISHLMMAYRTSHQFLTELLTDLQEKDLVRVTQRGKVGKDVSLTPRGRSVAEDIRKMDVVYNLLYAHDVTQGERR